TTSPPARPSLDEHVTAFEAARAADPDAPLADHLPPPNHPLYARVLAEFVRVDLELGWRAGRAPRLADYRARHPELFADPAALAALAYEEYRQRQAAGEHPDPAEYRARPGAATDTRPGRGP